MTAKKWGTALENGTTSEIEELKALLVEKGVITEDEALRAAKPGGDVGREKQGGKAKP